MITLTTAIGSAAYLGACSFALVKGGKPERWVATGLLADFVAPVFQNRHDLNGMQYTLLAGEVAVLALVLWVAFRFQRPWSVVAAAFQVLSVVTHLAKFADPTIHGWAYLTATVLFGYGVVIALTFGTWAAMRSGPRRAVQP